MHHDAPPIAKFSVGTDEGTALNVATDKRLGPMPYVFFADPARLASNIEIVCDFFFVARRSRTVARKALIFGRVRPTDEILLRDRGRRSEMGVGEVRPTSV